MFISHSNKVEILGNFFIDINYYNNNITFCYTNSNYSTTLQEQYHGE